MICSSTLPLAKVPWFNFFLVTHLDENIRDLLSHIHDLISNPCRFTEICWLSSFGSIPLLAENLLGYVSIRFGHSSWQNCSRSVRLDGDTWWKVIFKSCHKFSDVFAANWHAVVTHPPIHSFIWPLYLITKLQYLPQPLEAAISWNSGWTIICFLLFVKDISIRKGGILYTHNKGVYYTCL